MLCESELPAFGIFQNTFMLVVSVEPYLAFSLAATISDGLSSLIFYRAFLGPALEFTTLTQEVFVPIEWQLLLLSPRYPRVLTGAAHDSNVVCKARSGLRARSPWRLISTWESVRSSGCRAGPAARGRRTPPFLDALDTVLAQQAVELRQPGSFEGERIPGFRQVQDDGSRGVEIEFQDAGVDDAPACSLPVPELEGVNPLLRVLVAQWCFCDTRVQEPIDFYSSFCI